MKPTNTTELDIEQPNWNSTFMSSVSGAATHFGLEHSAPQLFVESGYFAALNIQRDLKPCGPYCWDHSHIVENLALMGLNLTWLHGPDDCRSSEFKNLILDTIRASDSDTVFGMAGLEFQLLVNLDDHKFTFTLPWGPEVPTCVRELPIEDWLAGKHFPGVAWFSLRPTAVATPNKRLHNFIESALLLYKRKEPKNESEYFFGPIAWERWATKLASNSYDKHGHWWSSMVWSEARNQAAEYFAKHWTGPIELGQKLRSNYDELAVLIAKSADEDTTNTERSDLIRQAQDIDSEIYQNLLMCRNYVRENELN